MKITWRCEDTEHGLLVEGATIAADDIGNKKFGTVEVIPTSEFNAEQLQKVLNKIVFDLVDMTKDYT